MKTTRERTEKKEKIALDGLRGKFCAYMDAEDGFRQYFAGFYEDKSIRYAMLPERAKIFDTEQDAAEAVAGLDLPGTEWKIKKI